MTRVNDTKFTRPPTDEFWLLWGYQGLSCVVATAVWPAGVKTSSLRAFTGSVCQTPCLQSHLS